MRKVCTYVIAALSATAIAVSLAPAASAAPAQDKASAIANFAAEHPQVQIMDKNFDPSMAVVAGGPASLGASSQASTSAVSPQASSDCTVQNRSSFVTSSYQESLDGCSVWGWNSSATLFYEWNSWIGINSGTPCVQVRGYSANKAISTPVWTDTGCTTGGKKVTVTLGERATVKKIRGKVAQVSKFAYVNWS